MIDTKLASCIKFTQARINKCRQTYTGTQLDSIPHNILSKKVKKIIQ